ncbi:hypothetical protein E4H12_01705, partial [Candidatus Thorarchaeota archaeon]
MNEDPTRIIEEYLTLVREKLPDSIAEDVVSELELYMLETARDQGVDGQITFESAKKVVAQFGAPGEVADEYRFSMLPESIPEEDIPKEIAQEPIASEQQVSKDEPIIRKVGVDPTVSHISFFNKSVFLSIMWATIITAATTLIGPIWTTIWYLILIVGQVLIVVGILFVRYLDLKRNNVILWKRSYPDWSKLQIFVTLPENGLPSYGKKRIFFDIIVSFIGLLSLTPMIFFGNNPWFIVFIGIPATVLFIARILISVRKLNDERNPCEKARLEFGINLSLLTILDSSFFWLFGYHYYDFNQFSGISTFLIVVFVLLGGAFLLLEVLMEAQNLWWKTEKKVSEEQKSRKVAIRKDILRNGGILLVKLIGWIMIVDS